MSIRDVAALRGELHRQRGRYDVQIAAYLGSLRVDDPQRTLEAHTRGWLLDQTLKILGWAQQTRIPEFPVDGPIGSTESRWFLDYLGYDFDEERDMVPLLIVEAKRLKEPGPTASARRSASAPSDVARLIVDALRGEDTLSGKWPGWLAKAAQYVTRTHEEHGRCPQTYALTNGEWFVIIGDAERAFIRKEPTTAQVVVFESWPAFVDGLDRALPHLHRLHLLERAGEVTASLGQVGQLSTSEGGVIRAARAVEVLYREDIAVLDGDPLPDLKVWPTLLLQCASGLWVRVRQPSPDGLLTLPLRREDFSRHLDAVYHEADALWRAVSSLYAKPLPEPSPVKVLHEDPDIAAAIPLVVGKHRAGGVSHYRVLTGTESHFIRKADQRAGACAFHRIDDCPNDRRAPDPHLRATSSRSFFKSGEEYACLHLTAREAKDVIRLDSTGRAACHLWAFETGLCCRTCTMEPICFSRTGFQMSMPCPQAERK